MLLTGKKVGHIRVERVIGHGGMGAVYEGFDEKLARRVALKVIRADRLDEAGRKRLLREAQTLSQLDHPNICRIYDCIEEPAGDILVLELIEGRTLGIALREPLHRVETLRIARAIASVMVTAHRAGIIHRDVKPENIMLTPASDVKVLDFGLARFVDAARNDVPAPSQPSTTQSSTFDGDLDARETAVLAGRKRPARFPSGSDTAVGTAVGTPVYMSPEQARGEVLTTASDMYSFGLLLQVLFGGDRPYQPDSTVRTIIEQASRGESAPPRGVERDLRILVQRLKSLAPSDRPTAVETLRRLELIAEKPKRIAQRAAAITLAVVAVAGTWKYTADLQRERASAIRAETEARLRRADADGLIGFMLGDLRKKLEPVGKLDILDDVAARSLKVLSSIDRERMTADELQRTATALDQVGEVRMAQGKLNDATQAFEQARMIAEEATRRAPADAEAQLTYATSHFWLGNALRLRGDLKAALAHMTVYRDVAVKLAARFPRNDKYQLESAYGYSTVGTILEAEGQLDNALRHYQMTRTIKAGRAQADPADLDRAGDLAVTLDKIGTVLQRLGSLAEARTTFESELALLKDLTAKQPDNMTWKRRLGTNYSYLSLSLENAGDVDQALELARAQLSLVSEVSARDPGNADRQRDLAFTHGKIGRLLRFQEQNVQSLSELRIASDMMQPLVVREPQRKDWHRDLGLIGLTRARTLLALGRAANAIAAVSLAEAELRRGPSDVVTRRALSEASIVMGDAQGHTDSARNAWVHAADVLRDDMKTNSDPSTMAVYAMALARLNRTAEASLIFERLEQMGYRHPDLSQFRKRIAA